MLLHLTRHGQPAFEGGVDAGDGRQHYPGDPVLSGLGREQAHRLGQRLKELDFAGRIISSPYRRSLETAALVAAEVQVRVHLHPDLRDIVKAETRIETFRGATLEELRRDFPCLADDVVLPYPWWTAVIDEREAYTAQLMALVEPLLAQEQDVLLVGHGATVNQLTRECCCRAGQAQRGNWFGAFNAQLTTFSCEQGRVEEVRICDISFLDADQVTANLTRATEAGPAIWHDKRGTWVADPR